MSKNKRKCVALGVDDVMDELKLLDDKPDEPEENKIDIR